MPRILLFLMIIKLGGAVQTPIPTALPAKLCKELHIIQKAAVRNNCKGDDFLILLAIRMAENGGPGKEFGVKHPKAWGTNLDTQAGWAAATIVNNRKRFERIRDTPENAQLIVTPFINFLANRYCPVASDPQGNIHWKRNVLYWYRKFSNEKNQTTWQTAVGTPVQR